MEEMIKLIFNELKLGDLTVNKAEKHLLDFYKHNIKECVDIGKREIYIGEEKVFPPIGINK
jgi:hypothetical protein